MSDIKIIDGVTSLDMAKELMGEFGEVLTDIDLPKITNKETAEITEQVWHQDGLQTPNQPRYQALWCEWAEDDCPSTQYISTRIPKELGEKYKDTTITFDFAKSIDDGMFFQFESEAQRRLYLRRLYKGHWEAVGQDEVGFYTRWNPMASEEILELRDAVFQNPIEEIKWRTHRLVVADNYTTLHRRAPNQHVNGGRILCRAYIR